jgi:Putative peptidoglycan binding domain
MKKFVTILIGCSLALAAGARAEQDPKNKKTKAVQKPVVTKQHTVPTHTGPNTHVQTHNQFKNPTLQNNAKIHANTNNTINKQQFHTVHPNNVPAVQTHNPVIQSNKLQTVQSNKFQVNKNVKNFQPQHQNFHAQVKSSVASVHFNQNFHIKNAQNWHGAHYAAFQNYHPQWHDHGWWHSHHNHVLLIGGGWYYWNAGYWYPAWGYDESAAYYPYDGPIYVGNTPKPFDQIVADVQTSLQEQGLYQGEIDGLVGPLTQEALAAYQSAQGLEQTAAIDQPTLESLGMG